MATVKRRVSTSGAVTYHIRCYDGYGTDGRQIERTMTWKPDANMSEKAIEKELKRQVVMFEDKVKKGYTFDVATRFAEYANRWLENNRPPQLAPKTYDRYKSLLITINQGIGEIRLEKLQSNHLLAFYNNLREGGIKKIGTFATTDKLGKLIADRGISKTALAKKAGVAVSTVSAATRAGGKISMESADKIAQVFRVPVEKIFHITSSSEGLSEKTILHHHRLISAILAQATRDRLIPFNIADRNYTKAPRVRRKEANFLEDYEVQKLISLLALEPIKWRTATLLLIYSGMRRGELMGLEWKDIDFENQVIHIVRTSQYVSSMGVITKDTKNYTSMRTLRLPEEAFELLEQYREWWEQTRSDMGDRWQYRIQITHVDGKTEVIDNDRLFVQDESIPMNPDSLTDWMRNFVKRNHLPDFSPHSLRHTNASLLIANGVNIPTVSKRLGHSNVSTTTKIYSHAIQSADEIASDILSSKLNPVKPRSGKA